MLVQIESPVLKREIKNFHTFGKLEISTPSVKDGIQ